MSKIKIIRELLIFTTIYILWSNYMTVKNLHVAPDSEALQPCLFYLPPIGIYAMYFTLIRLAVFLIRRRLKKKHSSQQ